MYVLRLSTVFACLIFLAQPLAAQDAAPTTNTVPEIDVTAICNESPALCTLAQRVQQMDEKVVEPKCHTYGGVLVCPPDPWPPDCGNGYIWTPAGCVPIMVEPYSYSQPFVDAHDYTSYWPVWWPRPWDIPRPPYPYPYVIERSWLTQGPLPDPWSKLQLPRGSATMLPSQAMPQMAGANPAGFPVLIGTDKGPEIIPDFCLRAEWAEGQIPPECAGLAGLVRKLGFSPDDAPLLKAAP
jgi:hypothetical protein